MKKNDTFTGTCLDLTYEGWGIVKHEEFPLFVRNVLPEEEGELVVTKVFSHYGFAKMLNRTKSSEHRVQPMCLCYGPCGGCQLQHASFEYQKQYKHNVVKQAFLRNAGMDVEVCPVKTIEYPWRYRNKVQVPVGTDKDGNLVLGFYRLHSHDIIPLQDCFLQNERDNDILHTIQKEGTRLHMGSVLRHIMIRDMENTDEAMVVLVVYKKGTKQAKELAEILIRTYPFVKSVMENVNDKDTNVVLGLEETVLAGKSTIMGKLHDLTFELSAKSFFQVNIKGTELLYETAVEFADLKKEDTAVDVYCGVGSISLHLAQKAKQVIGIEIVPEAIENARQNAIRNHIDNINFICADARNATTELVQNGYHPDVAVVDPPRKGCDIQTLEALVAMGGKRIVYVSCNPTTLARDCKYLTEHGYTIRKVQPVDMFPQTNHVETVVLLSKVQN